MALRTMLLEVVFLQVVFKWRRCVMASSFSADPSVNNITEVKLNTFRAVCDEILVDFRLSTPKEKSQNLRL